MKHKAGRSDTLCGDHAGNPGEIVGDVDLRPVGARREMAADVSRGIVAEFKDKNSTWPEELGGLPDDTGVELSSSGSAEQSGVGFVIADFAGKVGGSLAGDVRWIAGDEIEEM